MDPDQEYDYKTEHHGDVDRANAGSSLYAYFNIVCVIAGTGTLGLPYALGLGGWLGVLILFLAWTMSTYTGIILVKCLYADPKRRMSTYKEIATASFGVIGGWLTFFFNAWITLGAPVLYMVLAGGNLQELTAGTAGAIGTVYWTIICCVLMAIPFVLVKNMKEIAIMSAFGALATLVTVLIVLVVSCIHEKDLPPANTVPVIWPKFPIALSTISFSFGGNIIYPHVEASMKKPRQWPKVVSAGLATCAAMYFMTAVPGYYIYGDTVESPMYNSLPDGAPKIVAIVLMTVHVLLAAPLLTTSFSLDVEDMLNITVERFGKIGEFCIRFCLRVFITVVVGVIACTVPHFDALMSLIGSFANCGLILIFPVLFYWRLTGFRNKPIYEHAWCFLIILLGIVGLIFGTIDSIRTLVSYYQ